MSADLAAPAAPAAAAAAWTCPFCVLLCDRFAVHAAVDRDRLELAGGECPRASAALARFPAAPRSAQALVDGEAVSFDTAVQAAARALRASGQPLFGGLGTDVAGARALYRLACASGAICDAAQGRALMHGLRALQDRGAFTTTLAEVRARADLIVLLGGLHLDQAPRLFERLGLGDAAVAQRHVVAIGVSAQEQRLLPSLAERPGITVESLPLQGDLFDTLALLAAAVDQRLLREAPPALAGMATLAARLRAARYSVIVGAPAALPEHGALLVEGVNRLVGTLNRQTRAAALWLGGGDGAATVNQVFSWLSGLPLRSRAGPRGLEHEPLCFDADRLLANGAVDALLWVSSFDAEVRPPATGLPLVVLGRPELAATCARAGSVFIPVSTPGIGSAGHVFRTDGVVLLPLFAARVDTLPSVADVVGRIAVEMAA